jgi:enolase
MSAIVDIIGREILDSARQSNRRMRRAAGIGHHGPRGGALRRFDRLARSNRAARWRQEPLFRQGRAQGGENINTEISEAMLGLDANEQAFLDRTLIDLDGTDNKAAWAPTRRWPYRWRLPSAAAEESGLPLYRYFGGSGACSCRCR